MLEWVRNSLLHVPLLERPVPEFIHVPPDAPTTTNTPKTVPFELDYKTPPGLILRA